MRKQKSPDPDGFQELLHQKARATGSHGQIGANRELGKYAARFCISTETAGQILQSEGWSLVPTSSGTLTRWHPPAEER